MELLICILDEIPLLARIICVGYAGYKFLSGDKKRTFHILVWNSAYNAVDVR